MYKIAYDNWAEYALARHGLHTKTAAPVPWGLIAKRTATWAAPGAIAGGLYGAATAQPDENGEKNYLASIGKGALAGGALTAAGGHVAAQGLHAARSMITGANKELRQAARRGVPYSDARAGDAARNLWSNTSAYTRPLTTQLGAVDRGAEMLARRYTALNRPLLTP